MLRAYFDESGTHGEAHVTSIAGYVAAKSVWENVETEWDKEMSYYRERTAVRTFHLTDCLAGRGEFTGLDEFFRLAITSQLSRVLGRHEYNIAEKLTPIKEVVAWEESRNKHVPVDWHFTTADARVGLYPTI